LLLLAKDVHERGEHRWAAGRRSDPGDRLRKGVPVQRPGALGFEKSGHGRDGRCAQLRQHRGECLAVARQQVDQVGKDRHQAVGRQDGQQLGRPSTAGRVGGAAALQQPRQQRRCHHGRGLQEPLAGAGRPGVEDREHHLDRVATIRVQVAPVRPLPE
jgi:hypothetical protein